MKILKIVAIIMTIIFAYYFISGLLLITDYASHSQDDDFSQSIKVLNLDEGDYFSIIGPRVSKKYISARSSFNPVLMLTQRLYTPPELMLCFGDLDTPLSFFPSRSHDWFREFGYAYNLQGDYSKENEIFSYLQTLPKDTLLDNKAFLTKSKTCQSSQRESLFEYGLYISQL